MAKLRVNVFNRLMILTRVLGYMLQYVKKRINDRSTWLLLGYLVYAFPAFTVFIYANPMIDPLPFGDAPLTKSWLGIYAIIIAIGLIIILTGRSNFNIGPQEGGLFGAPNHANSSDLRVEYQEINTEIRYRDKQVTRYGYLNFATLGILAGVFERLPSNFEPAVTVLGFLLAMLFLVSIQSHSGVLKSLRERRKKIEKAVGKGIFALNSTSRIIVDNDGNLNETRPLLAQFSASRISIFIHWIIIVIWISFYLLSLKWALSP